jgi:hypothetical protein
VLPILPSRGLGHTNSTPNHTLLPAIPLGSVQVKDSKAQDSNTNNQIVLCGLKVYSKLIFIQTEFLVGISDKENCGFTDTAQHESMNLVRNLEGLRHPNKIKLNSDLFTHMLQRQIPNIMQQTIQAVQYV